jgi:hypothetical protein
MRERWDPLYSLVSNKAFNYGKSIADRMYEKVRRENNIVTVKGGGGLTITASGF